MEKFGYEIPCCPDKNIIGSITTTGRIFYGGRQQGPDIVADNDQECMQKCKAVIESMKTESWTNTGESWEIKLYE